MSLSWLERIGLTVYTKREKERQQAARHNAIQNDAIHAGQVWKRWADKENYQVLFLTNLYNGGHIQVVFSKHWAYVDSLPLEDFFEQFTHDITVDNSLASASDDLMAMASNMIGRSTIRKPVEGERWTRVDYIPNGFDEDRMPVHRKQNVTVDVLGIVEQSPAQPFVLYKEGEGQHVLNMHQFLNRYSPEGKEDVA